ncbi:MAG TPA: phytanoyl-CoA dioxygenase family protein [Streptosporangiaceae bacterium]|nr:phytanoyl-CoA dioxygenase family protein [Streptosporangiaceae bacterium]
MQGAAILSQAFLPTLCDRFVAEIEAYFADNPESREKAAQSILGGFQGPHSVTLHGLVGRIPSATEMVVQPDILGCARRLLEPMTDNVLLTIAEYMERRPGQPCQGLHRDTAAWPHVPVREDPVAVTVMGAMSDFTAANGATWIVPGSHQRADNDGPTWDEAIQAELKKGDALLFRSDLFHAGGANATENDTRRMLSLGYQVGWLRQVENTTLSVPPAVASGLPEDVQDLLGYSVEMVLGLYEGGHPRNALHEHLPQAVG